MEDKSNKKTEPQDKNSAKIKVGDTTIKAKVGNNLSQYEEETPDILYACRIGACVSCAVTVKEGGCCFNELTENEEMMGATGNCRLACQMDVVEPGEAELEPGWEDL